MAFLDSGAHVFDVEYGSSAGKSVSRIGGVPVDGRYRFPDHVFSNVGSACANSATIVFRGITPNTRCFASNALRVRRKMRFRSASSMTSSNANFAARLTRSWRAFDSCQKERNRRRVTMSAQDRQHLGDEVDLDLRAPSDAQVVMLFCLAIARRSFVKSPSARGAMSARMLIESDWTACSRTRL